MVEKLYAMTDRTGIGQETTEMVAALNRTLRGCRCFQTATTGCRKANAGTGRPRSRPPGRRGRRGLGPRDRGAPKWRSLDRQPSELDAPRALSLVRSLLVFSELVGSETRRPLRLDRWLLILRPVVRPRLEFTEIPPKSVTTRLDVSQRPCCQIELSRRSTATSARGLSRLVPLLRLLTTPLRTVASHRLRPRRYPYQL